MELMIGGVAFGLALICAAIMGLAIQRGATCTVAAMQELVAERRATRLVALVEASMWVAFGLLVGRELGLLADVPQSYALTRWTVFGAVLLGLGAVINRACMFGSIARLGGGDWAYLATPLGFYLGCISFPWVFTPMAPQALAVGSPVLAAPVWVLWLLAGLALARVTHSLWQRAGALRQPWSAHAATTVIGITFVAMFLLAGAWAYTDVLAELASGMARSVPGRILLALALLAGAVAGGWLSRDARRAPVTPVSVARCAAGGMVMGWGSLMIPGGNDGLILLGMPLLWSYAWVAFATMCLVVGMALSLPATRRLAS